MRNRLPLDAFQFYYALGEGRSYQAVADKYGVTKRAVAKLAAKEQWQQQIAELDQGVRTKLETSCRESIEAMTERHMKQIRAIQGRAVEALRAMPLDTAMEAVRALALAMKEERALRCGPDGEGEDVEAIIKREYERWMVRVDDEEEAATHASR
jgi:hypothetical protein